MIRSRSVMMFLCVVGWGGAVMAQSPGDGGAVQARLLGDHSAVAPGQTFRVGLLMDIAPKWHTYWLNPGDSGQTITIDWQLPDGWRTGAPHWPLPQRFTEAGLTTYGYTKQVMLIVDMTVAESAPADAMVTIAANVNWLECQQACVPGQAKLTIKLAVAQQATQANQMLFDQWRRRLPRTVDQAHDVIASTSSPRVGQVVIKWKQPVHHVDVFPATGQAVELAEIQTHHANDTTQIACQPTIYLPDQLQSDTARLLVTYRDAAGQRRGVYVPVKVRP